MVIYYFRLKKNLNYLYIMDNQEKDFLDDVETEIDRKPKKQLSEQKIKTFSKYKS